MTNEEFVRRAYAIAEVKDIAAWVACFNPDGVFVDESVGVTYRGPSEVGKPVENCGTAFSDMHRELYDVYVSGDVVVVELALQGTHDGPLRLPQGILPPTGNRCRRLQATPRCSRAPALAGANGLARCG
jgi:ketosteroid isomerase-like protein